MKTNEEVRKIISDCGITVNNVTDEQLIRLHKKLEIKLAESECFKRSFKINKLVNKKFMTCSSFYFDSREAVSFNRDGFIGFAGWADKNNVQPILNAVTDWALSEPILVRPCAPPNSDTMPYDLCTGYRNAANIR